MTSWGKKLKKELFRGENSVVSEDIHSFKNDVVRLAEPEIETIIEY